MCNDVLNEVKQWRDLPPLWLRDLTSHVETIRQLIAAIPQVRLETWSTLAVEHMFSRIRAKMQRFDALQFAQCQRGALLSENAIHSQTRFLTPTETKSKA
jgi:hypothetical protein